MLGIMDICPLFQTMCTNGKMPPGFTGVGYHSFFKKNHVNFSSRELMRIKLEDFFKCKIVGGVKERKCNIESALIGSYYSEDFNPNFCYTLYSHWGRPRAKVEKIKNSERIELEFYIDCSFQNRSADLDVVQYPKYNCITSPSIQLAMHSRYMVASPFVSGKSFRGGKKYRVRMKQHEKNLLPPPYQTNCTDYMQAWVARGGVGPLTQLMVVEECKLNATLKAMGCVPFFVDFPHNETICNYCDKAVNNCPSSRIGNNCTELLRYYNQPCTFVGYDMESEERLVNIDNSWDLTIKEKGYNCSHEKLYTRRCQTINIEILFDEFEISNITYNPKFESMELFSVIGGYLGMYLGVSLVAAYDLAETALSQLKLLLKKRKIDKEKSKRKKQVWGQTVDGFQYPTNFRNADSGSRDSDGFRRRPVKSYSFMDIY